VVAGGDDREADRRAPEQRERARPASARGRCERDAAGQPTRFPGVVVDVTERRQAEEAKELLARELSHRIKNIFTVVGGMVSLSAMGAAAEVRNFAGVLRRRLNALAAAHEYVRPHSPQSRPAEVETTLHGLLGKLLAPYAEIGSERVRVLGDDAPIGVKAATSLALILHELATNAAKYGALSRPEGRLSVTWELASAAEGEASGRVLRLRWLERGGPPVTVPDKLGFGARLLNRVLTAQLSAELEVRFEPEGLELGLTAPLRSRPGLDGKPG
jgi:two-component sensor histidine kinase